MHDRLLARKNKGDAVLERSAEIQQQPPFESSARLRVERAQRLTEDAVAMISHELRTPLGAVANWAQLLQRSPDDRQTVLRAAAAIERSVRLQVRLVDDLLDMTRIVAGRMELAPSELDLEAVVQSCSRAVVQSCRRAWQRSSTPRARSGSACAARPRKR